MTVKRDLGQEILESIQSLKKGEGKKYCINLPSDIASIRHDLRGRLHEKIKNRRIPSF